MHPDFNRLRVFYFIFKNKGIAAAAQALNITQSAVSQQLQKLESEIQAPLFTRLHRRLVPTAAGKRLYTIIQPFIRDLEKGLDAIRLSSEKPAGPIRLGAPVEFGKEYLPLFIASFRERFPAVTFNLQLGDPSSLLPLVKNGELDFAFVDVFLTRGLSHDNPGVFSFEPMIRENVILACSGSYYKEHVNGDHSLENLLRQRFIAYRPQALALKNWFHHHFGKIKIAADIVMTVDSVQAVNVGIRQGIGMGITASHFVHQEIASGSIVPIETGRKNVVNIISMVQLQDKVPSLTEKSFQTHFKRSVLQNKLFGVIAFGKIPLRN